MLPNNVISQDVEVVPQGSYTAYVHFSMCNTHQLHKKIAAHLILKILKSQTRYYFPELVLG